MSARDWHFRIADVVQSLDRIAEYVAGMDYATFCGDPKTIDAVVRNLEIIGEAAARMPEEVITLYPTIPWHAMRGLRNFLIHEYFGVDLSIIWQTVQGDLPALRLQLQLFSESGEENGDADHNGSKRETEFRVVDLSSGYGC